MIDGYKFEQHYWAGHFKHFYQIHDGPRYVWYRIGDLKVHDLSQRHFRGSYLIKDKPKLGLDAKDDIPATWFFYSYIGPHLLSNKIPDFLTGSFRESILVKYSLEEMLIYLSEEVQTELLFHLDIFNAKLGK